MLDFVMFSISRFDCFNAKFKQENTATILRRGTRWWPLLEWSCWRHPTRREGGCSSFSCLGRFVAVVIVVVFHFSVVCMLFTYHTTWFRVLNTFCCQVVIGGGLCGTKSQTLDVIDSIAPACVRRNTTFFFERSPSWKLCAAAALLPVFTHSLVVCCDTVDVMCDCVYVARAFARRNGFNPLGKSRRT